MIPKELFQDSPKSPSHILMQSGYIKSITYPNTKSALFLSEHNHFITENEKVFLDKTKRSKSGIVENLFITSVAYINAPTIEDKFTDDHTRNEYEKELHITRQDVFDFYQSNRLRKSNIRRILQLSLLTESNNLIMENEGLKNLRFSALCDVSKQAPSIEAQSFDTDLYESLNIVEKIGVTEKVEKFARDLCVYIISKRKRI